MLEILASAWVFALAVFLYVRKSHISPRLRGATGQAWLLVTAHPDDEAMFFSPLLHRLSAARVRVFLLCLSNGAWLSLGRGAIRVGDPGAGRRAAGDADGLGPLRELELARACAHCAIRGEDAKVVNDPDLRDGMESRWPEPAVARHVARRLAELPAVDAVRRGPDLPPPTTRARAVTRVTQVVTFDERGVSGHANHVAVCRGVARWAAAEGQRAAPVYHLESHPVWLKFLGPIAAVWLWALDAAGLTPRGSVTALNGSVTTTWAAMSAHASQLVWFRHLFLLFSAYSFANHLHLVPPPEPTRTRRWNPRL